MTPITLRQVCTRKKKQLRDQRRRDELCPCCGRYRDDGFVLCARCREKRNAAKQTWRQKNAKRKTVELLENLKEKKL
jgi:hypothetical protein